MPLHGWEFLIVVVVMLIVFGVGKLSQALGALGKGVRIFRKAVAGEDVGTNLPEPKKEKDTSDLASTSS